jgi:hypothetical protein
MMVQVRVSPNPPTGKTVTLATACFLLACSPHHEKQPAALGDCIPQHGASCTGPTSAAGGAGGGDDSDGGNDANSSRAAAPDAADAGACGAVLLVAQSPTCQQCIANACCLASTACSADPQCQALVTCVQTTCASGVGIGACAAMCQSNYPTATMAYDDLSSCSQANCPVCPALPTATLSDL